MRSYLKFFAQSVVSVSITAVACIALTTSFSGPKSNLSPQQGEATGKTAQAWNSSTEANGAVTVTALEGRSFNAQSEVAFVK